VRTNKTPFFLLYVAAEVTLLYLFWHAFGGVATISLLLLGFLLGLLVMRLAGRQAFRALTDAERRAAAFGVPAPNGSQQVIHGAAQQADLQRAARDLGSSALLLVAGLLLAAPGILSDIAGLFLLLPGVRARTARRVGRRMGSGLRGGPTITVVTDQWSAQQWPTDADRDEPPVIRGEILPPDDRS
jgi:UPF0716 protein FxsA